MGHAIASYLKEHNKKELTDENLRDILEHMSKQGHVKIKTDPAKLVPKLKERFKIESVEESTEPSITNDLLEKKGKEITPEEAHDFVKSFKDDADKIASLVRELKKIPGVTDGASRLKDPNSLYEKLQGRMSDSQLKAVNDAIGTRILFSTIKDQKKMVDKISGMFEIVKIKENVDVSREDGYRAVHIIFKIEGYKNAELQMKTNNQQTFSAFTHDNIYKGEDKIKNNPSVKKYVKQLSDYLYKIDTGEIKDEPNERPEPPEILAENDIEFPWEWLENPPKDLIRKGFWE